MLGKGSRDHTILPQTPCVTLPLHLVVPSATLPPASPDPTGIAPEKHTHGHIHTQQRLRITRIVTASLVQCSPALEKKSSPVGGAPVLPATSPDAFDPPHGPTTSWMRRG